MFYLSVHLPFFLYHFPTHFLCLVLRITASANKIYSLGYNIHMSIYLFPYTEYWTTVYAIISCMSSLTRSNAFNSRYMGTITGICDLDSVRWPNSHWRSVKVYFGPVLLLFLLVTTCPCQPFLLQIFSWKRYYYSTPLMFVLPEIPTSWFCMITNFTCEWI